MKILQNLSLLFATLLIFSYAPHVDAQPRELKDNDKVAQEITERNQQWMAALEKGDVAGVAAMYSQNSMFMAPNIPLMEGREEIQEYLEAARESGITKIKLKSSEIEALGDRAVETGSYEIMVNGDVVVDEGKYMVEWKNENGEWLMHRDMFNSDLPAPRVVARDGDKVSVVVHNVRPDRKDDYEDFVRNILLPSIDQTKTENRFAVMHTRFLVPNEPSDDGSYRFMFVMDPVIEGADYSIENVIKSKFGEVVGKKMVADLDKMMAGPYDAIYAQQSEF